MSKPKVQKWTAVEKVEKSEKAPSQPSQPLRTGLSSESQFPVKALPASLRSLVEAVSFAEKVPIVLPSMCALGVVSGAIGRGLRVRSGRSRTTGGNLYLVASGESGAGKSHTYDHFIRPLAKAEAKELEAWAEEVPYWEAERDVIEAEVRSLKDSVKKTDESERGELVASLAKLKEKLYDLEKWWRRPRWLMDDFTVEALEIQMSRDETMFHASPDARQIIENLMGKHSGGQPDDALFLKGYSGERHRSDRVGRGSTDIDSPIIALLWLVQPDKLDRMLSVEGLSAGGFLPRCMVSHTRTKPRLETGDEGYISPSIESDWESLVADLVEFRAPRDEEEKLCHRVVECCSEASEIIRGYQNQIAANPDYGDVCSFSARWAENAWRVALVLHASRHGKASPDHRLCPNDARSAVEVVSFFAEQQLGILARQREDRALEKVKEIAQVLRRHDGKMTMYELCRRDRFDRDEVWRLAKTYPSLLGAEEIQTGGRPSVVVTATIE